MFLDVGAGVAIGEIVVERGDGAIRGTGREHHVAGLDDRNISSRLDRR